MYLRRKLNKQGGFTLAEIFVAGLIMAVALIPVVRMFDTSYSGIRNFEDIQKSIDCAREATEQIRSLPFYEPYNPTFGKVDIDDNFWGSRNPINTNPGGSTPDWASIPEVEYYDYGGFSGYESYRVGVKLAYLNNDTGMAVMKDDWGPMAVGKDRPTDDLNKSIHLLLIQVNVYWMADGSETSYTIETIVTDTEALYDLGISSIIVLGPASIMDPTRTNAAAHWPDATVQVQIKGWGFNTDAGADLNVKLVRDKNNDIPINITSKTEDTILGTVNLYSTGTDIAGETDWYPKAAIGFWSVKVNQEEIYSTFLYNGFVVQYPKPVISNFGNASDMSKTGLNNESSASLKVEGGPFVNKVKNPAVRLIRFGESDEILDQIDGTVTNVTVPAGTYGYANTGCTITATFNLTQGAAGEYHMFVVNTDDPTMMGHVQSDPSVDVYTIIEVTPEPDDAYVNGISPIERRVYKNAGNPWRIRVVGNYFNIVGSPPVDVYLCSEVVSDLPAGDNVQGTNIGIISTQAFLADFDVSGLPEGSYKVFVRNRNDGACGWTDGAPITVTTFNSSLTGFAPTGSDLFWENYYDIASRITGTGLDAATRVTIISTTTATTEYDITSDCTFTSPEEVNVDLNLINCSNARAWSLRVYFIGGYYLEQSFAVTLGHARIIPANDTKPAISIQPKRGYTTYEWNYETLTSRAWAYRATGTLTSRRAYATFRVEGMGFPIAAQTNLRVWGSSVDLNGDYNCTMDRDNKQVYIQSDQWRIYSQTAGDYNIEVYRAGDSGNKDSYTGRWELRD